MNEIASYSIPVFIILVLIFALFKRVNIWNAFTLGGKNGLKCAFDILPSLVGLVVAIELLSQSGALTAFSNFASPVTRLIGIPQEILPLSLMRSISGSGSMAVFQNILSNHPPDGYIARCASVIMGSTE
ncbi:MAG: spore maturation protein, partial [Clostridia bacterium]|nr:spore maturation protein [Clostridia bacterium]